MKMKRDIKAVLFDMDGALLNTETLSDKAVFRAFGDLLPSQIAKQLGNCLPWGIKEPTLGLQGHKWIPLVLQCAQENWGVAAANGAEESKGGLPPAPSV